MRVVIVGAGKSGLYLAQQLKSEHDVTLIESRFDRAEVVEAMMPDVTVVHGDACEPEVLEHAKIGQADLVIAVTGDDEDNLVVAMLSKHFGAGKVFARINHPKNEWLFDQGLRRRRPGLLDLDDALARREGGRLRRPRHAAAASGRQRLHRGDHAAGDAHAVGKTLAELPLPENSHVMAIINPDRRLTIAKGDTVLARRRRAAAVLRRRARGRGLRGARYRVPASDADRLGGRRRRATHRRDERPRAPVVLSIGRALATSMTCSRLVVEARVVGHVGDDDAFLAEELLLDPERRLVVQHRVGGVHRRVLRHDDGDDVVLGRPREVAHVVERPAR